MYGSVNSPPSWSPSITFQYEGIDLNLSDETKHQLSEIFTIIGEQLTITEVCIVFNLCRIIWSKIEIRLSILKRTNQSLILNLRSKHSYVK